MGDVMTKVMMTSVNGTTRIDPSFCPHERRLDYESGGVFLSHGEYDDDIVEHTICLDCGIEIEQPPVSTEPMEVDDATLFWIMGGKK